ncbi:hypothetical protein DPMN_120157 [Dreissena polymorpha]|uniref:Uncharacterized protein n=1 Tax=Dreissena polymorpha TaxID=45954 RepID=A0A9D4JNA5_DREPO|nr:hypothetical protein DPMN_120157 [Dreissena polymorpha]
MTGLQEPLFFEQGKGDCKILENKGREPFLPPVFPGVREWSLEVVDVEIPDLLGRKRVGAFFRTESEALGDKKMNPRVRSYLEPSICEVQ